MGCSGNIKSGGGVYGRDAAILCRSGYEVCESAAYAAKLGLSEEICHDPSIFTNDKHFLRQRKRAVDMGGAIPVRIPNIFRDRMTQMTFGDAVIRMHHPLWESVRVIHARLMDRRLWDI